MKAKFLRVLLHLLQMGKLLEFQLLALKYSLCSLFFIFYANIYKRKAHSAHEASFSLKKIL